MMSILKKNREKGLTFVSPFKIRENTPPVKIIVGCLQPKGGI